MALPILIFDKIDFMRTQAVGHAVPAPHPARNPFEWKRVPSGFARDDVAHSHSRFISTTQEISWSDTDSAALTYLHRRCTSRVCASVSEVTTDAVLRKILLSTFNHQGLYLFRQLSILLQELNHKPRPA
jgi:hypothetical protein